MTREDRTFLQRQREIAGGTSGHKPPPIIRTSKSSAVEPPDCGPRALQIALSKIAVRADLAKIKKLAGASKRGTSLAGLKKAAEAFGIHAEGIQVDSAALREVKPPAIVWVDGNHFLILVAVDGDDLTVRDHNNDKEEVMKTDELIRKSGGILLTLTK